MLDLLTNNITLSSQIILEGCLVNLYGKNGNQYYSWKTDLTIGNYACEIMLVENIIISIDN
ncbi:MAG: hypothetical protein KKC68_05235 [Candidatus Thermoplasmatota archaeon]|nr:hypothetical protein [Candidatus Thermoplasmatota archaeon]